MSTNQPSEIAGTDAVDSLAAPKIQVRNLNFYYGATQALFDNSIAVAEHAITALIGPSGCGKSTHIRTYNRMFGLYKGFRADGEILLDGQNILSPAVDPIALRMRVGMVFQRPTPFPMSVRDNVGYGLKVGIKLPRTELNDRVEVALKQAALWDEVKERLHSSALALSGGQQQRLCIARTLAVQPEVILLDEPCSALDPVATARIEELMIELKRTFTLVVVTHSMQQAARVSDFTAFLYNGRVVEFNDTRTIFTNPEDQRTENYITGKFG